jgi:hypothetical protein
MLKRRQQGVFGLSNNMAKADFILLPFLVPRKVDEALASVLL